MQEKCKNKNTPKKKKKEKEIETKAILGTDSTSRHDPLPRFSIERPGESETIGIKKIRRRPKNRRMSQEGDIESVQGGHKRERIAKLIE